MATLPKSDVHARNQKLSLEEAASELHRIVEAHFDEIRLTEAERDKRYAMAKEFLDAKDAANAKG